MHMSVIRVGAAYRWYYRPQELPEGLTAEGREVFRSDERSTHPLNSGAHPIDTSQAAPNSRP